MSKIYKLTCSKLKYMYMSHIISQRTIVGLCNKQFKDIINATVTFVYTNLFWFDYGGNFQLTKSLLNAFLGPATTKQ